MYFIANARVEYFFDSLFNAQSLFSFRNVDGKHEPNKVRMHYSKKWKNWL